MFYIAQLPLSPQVIDYGPDNRQLLSTHGHLAACNFSLEKCHAVLDPFGASMIR